MLKILYNTNCANMNVQYGEDSDKMFSYCDTCMQKWINVKFLLL